MSFPHDLIICFDFTVERFRDRIAGLGDDEFFYEPTQGSWTVRETAPGTWILDGTDSAGEERVPTIAWRMAHISCSVLGGFSNWLVDHANPYEPDPDVPHSASGAIERFDRNWRRWRDGMAALDDAAWASAIGPSFGPYAKDSTFALALHVLDEFVHHGAEVALLRDLYASRA